MFGFNKNLKIYAPITGKLMPITEVPDEVFSTKMVGNGVCIEPSEGLVVSPVDGEIATIFDTNHAVALKAADGTEMLIHIGMDTVGMNGEGFERLVKVGQKVKVGEPLVKFDIELIKSKGLPTITPIIITGDIDDKKIVSDTLGSMVSAGKDIAFTYKLK